MTTPRLAVRRGPAWNAPQPKRPALADLPAWLGASAAVVGLVALLGWMLDAEVLKSTVPGLLTMKANTAACIALLGAGVVVLSRAERAAPGRWIGLSLVGAAASIALATAAEYLTGVDLGIDQLVFREASAQAGTHALGRMSPLSAICGSLLGIAAVLAGARAPWAARARARWIVISLVGVSLALAVLNLFDFAFDAAVPPLLLPFAQMAPNTAATIAVLSIGVVGLLGRANPFASLANPSPTGSLWRRLFAVSVVFPVAIAWLRIEGQKRGFFDTSFGTSLMLVGILSLGIISILRSARWANELEATREALEIERDRFFELSLDMLSVIGADGRFRRVNRAWTLVLGYPEGALVGRSFLELLHPDDVERTSAEAAHQYGEGEESVGFQNRYRHHDGSYRWLEWMSTTSPDLSVAYGVARDVTDRKRAEDRRARRQHQLETRNEALSERVIQDPLTGLHNRRYFDTAVARLERRWSRLPIDRRPPVSVIIFDLDHFGQVNKLHGHQAGDAVLRVFAGLLRKRFREVDLVARYGGEEFVAVLEGATSAAALLIAEDVRVAFEHSAIDIGTGVPVHVTVSAGCAELGDDRNASAGLSLADVWLSQAKRAGRNQVVGLHASGDPA